MPPEVPNPIGGEAVPPCRPSPLAVQDARDDRVGVVHRQAPDQGDRLLGGAKGGRTPAPERDREFGDRAAAPAERELGAELSALHRDVDLFEQRAEQFLAIAVRRRWSSPDDPKIGTECVQSVALRRGQRPRAGGLAARQLRLGGGAVPQALLPFRFQPASHEAILGLHRAIAPLRAVGCVPRAFHRQTPLRHRGVVLLFEVRFGPEGRLDPGGRHGGEEVSGPPLRSICAPPTRRQ